MFELSADASRRETAQSPAPRIAISTGTLETSAARFVKAPRFPFGTKHSHDSRPQKGSTTGSDGDDASIRLLAFLDSAGSSPGPTGYPAILAAMGDRNHQDPEGAGARPDPGGRAFRLHMFSGPGKKRSIVLDLKNRKGPSPLGHAPLATKSDVMIGKIFRDRG